MQPKCPESRRVLGISSDRDDRMRANFQKAFNNCLPKGKLILLDNPREEVEGIIK